MSFNCICKGCQEGSRAREAMIEALLHLARQNCQPRNCGSV